MRREPEQALRHRHPQHGNGRLGGRANGRFYSLKACPGNGRLEYASRTQGSTQTASQGMPRQRALGVRKPHLLQVTRRLRLCDAVREMEENVEMEVE